MNRGGKDERVDVALDFNPYADIDGSAANPFEAAQARSDLTYQKDDLSEYCLPEHKNQIDYFRVMHHDIFECQKRYLPNVILTATSRNEVFIWQENLMTVSLKDYKFIFNESNRLTCNLCVCILSVSTVKLSFSTRRSWISHP